ncbi:MAG: PilZ domain-containing protein [Candidatus Omnitrophota bacterium]
MGNKENPEEKRKSKRVEKHLIIQFSVDTDASARKWDITSIQDIGENGVSFLANGKFSLGSTVHMLIRIPLRPFEWFEVAGKLVAVEKPRNKNFDPDLETSLLRVSFLDLEKEQKVLIHKYILWCLSILRGGAK